jgi:ring-1,2-phenylacetyl-CoA epoxidase subunit PaaC
VTSTSTSIIDQTLHFADSCLILGQKNSEWCAHGPILEQDIAITNITLDLIGQARNFYQYAAELLNAGSNENHTEDTLAYLRNDREFKNFLICELPNGDWAQTVLRQFFFSSFQQLLFEELAKSSNEQLSAIAVKSIKEIHYHVKWSSEWVIRLGDGTEESHNRMVFALEQLWSYTGEFFMPAEYDCIDVTALKAAWLEKINAVLEEATLTTPESSFMQSGGKNGIHTEHIGFILAEMQSLQRAYPGAEW